MAGQRSRGVLLMVAFAVASLHAASAAEFRPDKEPEWKRQMREKLKRRVTCEFAETPLADVIPVLQRQTGVTITIEASARAVQRHRLTCRFEKAALGALLERFGKIVGFDYVLRENGIFISTRAEIGEEGEIRNEPEWKLGIRKKLGRRVSFEFVDTPLSECVQFLQTLTKINMIFDSRALEMRGNTPITLTVRNESLRDAFDRVLEIARFDYALIDEAMFISTRKRIEGLLAFDAKLAAARAVAEGRKEPEWKRYIRRMLARTVTFEFVDTPVQESVQFLQTLTKATFIMDPVVFEVGELPQVSLRVNNMSLDLALRWTLRLAGLRYTLKTEAIWISTPENVLAEVRRGAKPEAKKSTPEWERDFRKRFMRRKVSFEFVDTPLSETIQFLQTLSKCSMTLDPRAVEARGNTPINLKVSAMLLGQALDWILRLADLEYAFKDGAIFISTPEIIAREREAGRIPGSPRKPPPETEDVF